MRGPVRSRAEQRDGAGEPLAEIGMSALGHRRQIERGRAAEQGPEHREDQRHGDCGQPRSPDRPPYLLREWPGEVGPHAQHGPDRPDEGDHTHPPKECRSPEAAAHPAQHTADRGGQRRDWDDC